MFSLAYKGGGSWNDTFWAHERFDQLLIACASRNRPRRSAGAMYFEMQQIVRNEGGVVVPMFANYVLGNWRTKCSTARWPVTGIWMVTSLLRSGGLLDSPC